MFESVLIGIIKTAIKTAIKKMIQKGTTEVVGQALKSALKKKITDADALIINRLKSKMSGELLAHISKEMGIPTKEVKKIVNLFNQSKEMKSISTGANFRDIARRKMKSIFNTTQKDSIKDILRKIRLNNREGENKEGIKKPNFNTLLKSKLKQLEVGLSQKVNGRQGARNQWKQLIYFDTSLMKYYDASKEYTYEHLQLLSTLEVKLEEELERASSGEGIILIDDGKTGGDWSKYDASSVYSFIRNFREDVRLILKA